MNNNIPQVAGRHQKVLIVMPVWNQLDFTKQAITSLREHTNETDYILLIVNNGSTDDTNNYVSDLIAKSGAHIGEGSIDYIHNEQNEGWTGACNQIFDKILAGDFDYMNFTHILLANNDILFEAGWLPKMLKRFNNDDKVGIVGPTSDRVAGFQSISCNMPGLKTEYVRLLVGFFFMMKREVLEKVGRFDEETFGKIGGGEEFDFCIRAKELGYKCAIARDVFIKHFCSQTLQHVAGGWLGSDPYNRYCEDKDNKLVKKWGEDALTFSTDDRLKIMLCLPLRTDYSGHKSFWISLLMMAKPGRWEIIECTRAMVADARNLMVQKAMELGCTHILFADDDHIYVPDVALRLLEHDIDIVGTLAYQRKKPYTPCVYNAVIDPANGDIGLTPIEIENTGLREVTAIGFSFVLIKVAVFQKMPFPWFVYGDKSVGIHDKLGGLGEDLSFCIKAGRAGYKVFCESDIVVPHIGDPIIVDGKTYEEYKALQGNISNVITI